MSEESTFDDMAEDLFDNISGLGRAATYVPVVGDPVSCSVNWSKEVDPQPVGYDSQTWASANTVEYLLDEVGQQASRGDKFLIGSTELTVQAVIGGDDRFVKVAVK